MSIAFPKRGVAGLVAPTGGASDGGGGVAPSDGWTTALDLDLSALSTLDLDHTAGSVSIGGAAWTQVHGATALGDIDIVNGNGLVADMSAANTVFNPDTPTIWSLYRALSAIIPSFSEDMVIEVTAKLSDLGDAASELHGIVVRSTSGTSYAVGAMIGHNGTAKCVRTTRQQGATASLADTTAAVATHDSIRLLGRRFGRTVYSGVSVGGELPTTWLKVGEAASNIAASADAADFPVGVGFVAQTGNTSNNFAPAWGRLRVRYSSVGAS
jgi:hypothetical protein